jgi:hypothetical protein
MFTRDQSQVAGDLFATLEARHLAERELEGERGDGAHSRMGHEQPCFLIFFGGFFRRLVQLPDLLV